MVMEKAFALDPWAAKKDKGVLSCARLSFWRIKKCQGELLAATGRAVGREFCAPCWAHLLSLSSLEDGVAGGKGPVEAAGDHGNAQPGSEAVDAILCAAQEGGIGGQDAGQGKDKSSPEQDNKGKFDEGHIYFLLESLIDAA